MQPYLFPYIGYFQLIGACDNFVVHDDVQYIRQGWINRNHIILHKQKSLFVFSVQHDDYSKKINERFYADTFTDQARKFLRNIVQSYSKAPYFAETWSLISDILGNAERNVAKFNTWSIRRICQYLGIETEILVASEGKFDKTLTGQDRVIAINQSLGSTHYINPIGGQELYSRERFEENGMQISFLKPRLIPYKQLVTDFLPSLSIIDVLMNCSRENILQMLEDYDLL